MAEENWKMATRKWVEDSPVACARLFQAGSSVDLELPHSHIMEEFTGDEASQNNQIFPEETSPVVPQHEAAAVPVPSYAPDSHVPTAAVRWLKISSHLLSYLIILKRSLEYRIDVKELNNLLFTANHALFLLRCLSGTTGDRQRMANWYL